MQKLKLGIIGVGHLGEIHTRLAKEIEIIDLVGIFDINLDRAKEISKKYEVPFFTSVEELLTNVDAVSVVVPTKSHYEVANKALDYDVHLFIEKPITSTLEEGKSLIEKAKEKGLKIQVGHIERFNPAFLALQRLDLNPLFIEGHRLSKFNPRGTDVSVVLDLMIHDIDIVLQLIKSEVKSIDSCGVKVVSDSEDIANVRLGFENGSVANLTASRISLKNMRKMRIFQKYSYITIDFLEKKTEVFTLKESGISPEKGMSFKLGTGKNVREVVYFTPSLDPINPLETELFLFAKSILEDKKVPVPPEEALRALEVAYKILYQIKHP